jgi:biotin operon repressor
MTEQTQKEILLPHFNTQVPVEVLLHPEIDAYALKIFAYMKLRYQFFAYKQLPFMESNSTISERTGVSRSKVIESINTLVSLGFVIRQERHGKGSVKKEQTNIYVVKDILTPNGEVVWQEKKVKKSKEVYPQVKREKEQNYPSFLDDFEVPF